MIYRTCAARPPLDAVVKCFWILRDDAPADGAPFERVYPDGCPELVFHRGDPFVRRHWSEARPATQHRAAVVGQLDRWIDIRPTGRVHILGVRFRPAGAAAVFREEAHRLTGRSVALDALRGREGAELEARVLEAADDREAVAAVEEALLRWLGGREPGRRAVDAAVAALEGSRGAEGVEAAAGRAGLGRRQVERLFRSEVGIPPKRLARVLRFQEALRLLQEGRVPGIAAAAVAAGYFDQAHLHRDFLEFAGEPPAMWAAGERPLTDHFLE